MSVQSSTPPAPSIPEVMCFLDFWNHEITIKEMEPGFKTDWFKLPQLLVQAAMNEIGNRLSLTQMKGRFNLGGKHVS